MMKDQSIIDNLNKYEFEEVVEDFIEIDGDFTPGSAPCEYALYLLFTFHSKILTSYY